MKKKEYTQAGVLYFIATLFNKGIGFITVPIFSRILSTSDYGMVTTFNSWVSTLGVFLSLALFNSIRNSFVDFKNEERKSYLSSVLTFTCIIFVIAMLGCFAVSFWLPQSVSMAMIYLCVIQGFGHAVLSDYNYYLMMRYRYKARTVLMVLPSLISVVISIVTIVYVIDERLYLGRIVPTTVVHFVFAVVILAIVFSRVRPQLNTKYIKYGLLISLPLVLHSIALHILSQSDRIMISALRSPEETGIYSLVYNLGMIATVITSSLDGIWVPWFNQALKRREIQKVNTIAVDYVHLMTYAMVALILGGPEILKIFADSRYWSGISIIPPIVLANYMIFMYTLYVQVEHFHKKTPYITLNTLIAAGSNLVLNFIFIPKYGYIAAAYTTLASYFIAFVLHARYAKKIEPQLYHLSMFILPLVQIALVTVVYYPLIEHWVVRWLLMIVYILTAFMKQRYRLGALFPALAMKSSFFRDKE